MTELGVGIIGFGFIGKVHAFAYSTLPYFYDPPPARIRLVGVCTSRKETAERAKRDYGFEFATTDFGEILSRDDIQAVNICTPNHLHREQLLDSIRSGKHIYCEKPLTARWDEAAEVARALRGYAGVGQMTLNCRFSPYVQRAKQMIEDGFLGRVTHFRAGYFHSGSVAPEKPMGWKQEAASGGGVINDLASHVIDLVDWLIGPIREVQAETRILYPSRPGRKGGVVPVDAEDAVVLMAKVADGGVGVVEASKIATGTEDELRVEIHGERGAIRFNSMEPNHLEAYSRTDPEEPIGGTRGWKRIDTVHRYSKPAGWPGPKFAVGWIRSHVHCLYNFVSAVAEGRGARPSLADGVCLQHILEMVRRSAEERSWRRVEQERPG